MFTANFAAANFIEGNWQGRTYRSDDGKLLSCGVTGRKKGEVAFYIHHMASKRWFLLFTSSRWNLRKGTVYDVELAIDDYDTIHSKAQVTQKDALALRTSDVQKIAPLLKRGQSFQFTSPVGNVTVDLKDTNKAMQRLERCIESQLITEQHLQGDEPSTAVSDASRATNAQPTSYYEYIDRTSATVFVANLLTASGVTGFRILEEDRGRGFENSVMWEMPGGGRGSFVAIKNQKSKDLNSMVSREITVDTRKCAHTFVSGKKPAIKSGDASMQRIFTACRRDNGASYVAHYTYVKTSSGTVVRITQWVERAQGSDEDDAQEESDLVLLKNADWTLLK